MSNYGVCPSFAHYQYGVAQHLVVSVDLPLYGFTIEATPAQPYLGIKLDLDPAQLCNIIAQTRPATGKNVFPVLS